MITKTAMRFTQKDKKIFFTTFTALELDRFCTAATLNEDDLDNVNRYQREIMGAKVNNIAEWWDNEENYLPNPIIIYFPDSTQVEVNFAEGQDMGNIRFEPEEDMAQVLDGQHRANGCLQSVSFRQEPLPVMIVIGGETGDFSPREVGRMFITMNSKSDKIGQLLEMHLLARNEIPPWDRANQLGYRLMRRLHEEETNNPLFDEIQIIDGRHGYHFKAKKLALTFNELGQYPPEQGGIAGLNTDQSFRLITGYLTAICNIWDEAWASDSSALYSEDIMEQVLKLFRHFYLIARENMTPGRNTPTAEQWRIAINGTDPENPLSDYISFFDPVYTTYGNARRQHEIKSLIQQLRPNHGPTELGVLEDYENVETYLSQRPPDEFEISLQDNSEDNLGIREFELVDGRVEDGLFILWPQSRLAAAKADISIEIQQGDEWVVLQRRKFTCGSRHDLFTGQIPRGWRNAQHRWSAGNTYRVNVIQNSPTNISQESEIIFSFI